MSEHNKGQREGPHRPTGAILPQKKNRTRRTAAGEGSKKKRL